MYQVFLKTRVKGRTQNRNTETLPVALEPTDLFVKKKRPLRSGGNTEIQRFRIPWFKTPQTAKERTICTENRGHPRLLGELLTCRHFRHLNFQSRGVQVYTPGIPSRGKKICQKKSTTGFWYLGVPPVKKWPCLHRNPLANKTGPCTLTSQSSF